LEEFTNFFQEKSVIFLLAGRIHLTANITLFVMGANE